MNLNLADTINALTQAPAFLPACLTISVFLLLFAFIFFSGDKVPERPTFDIPTPKLALILYESTRAYRASQGDLRHKSYNNLPVLTRRGLVNKLAAYRRRPYTPAATEPFEAHLQAAIVALVDAN